jgi:acetyl-CoA C-acetyltransferase
MEDVVIVSAVRTAIGAFLGSLKDTPAPRLGAAVITEAVRRAGVPTDGIDEVLMGCVLPAGLGQAPARQAAIYAGLAQSTRCTTINRVCGSGLKTVMLGAQMIQTGDADVVVAGGMENMSRAPYLLEKAREGYRLGHGKLIDSMIHDGLWDAYGDKHMGDCAELCARERKVSRADQDRYAVQSYRRAQAAIAGGLFRPEIVAVEVTIGKEKKPFDTDEEPGRAKLDKFGELKPAFLKDGTVTAGNASSLSDGASALVVTSRKYADAHGLKPMARIVAQASHAQAPEWFTTAPVGAIQKVLKRAGVTADAVDRWEINEAFSVVALACVGELRLNEEKVNTRGGAVAIGHPIGASGARILTTLAYTLQQERKRYGVATLCIGGGEASAVLIEALS